MYSEKKKGHNLEDFLNLVEALRSPKGCPWDKIHTHEDLRTSLIEKAYDVLGALDVGDSESLKEELAEMLLQMGLHCSVSKEKNEFSFDEVIDAACKKIIESHPQIFSKYNQKEYEPKRIRCEPSQHPYEEPENRFKTVDLRDFHAQKRAKGSAAASLSNVSKILPALMRTEKIQERAAKGGYGLFSAEDALNESFERLHYLENLIIEGKEKEYKREIGNLLFAITEISRLVGVDAECALYDSCERFKDEVLYKMSRS